MFGSRDTVAGSRVSVEIATLSSGSGISRETKVSIVVVTDERRLPRLY